MRTTANDPVDAVLAAGLKDLWYPICPSDFVAERPVSLRRLGRKFVLWRETSGTLHALEDHCPASRAPLSMGIALGDRIACGYHGVQVRFDGVVTSVPGSRRCKLEGAKATRSFHVTEAAGAIFLYNSTHDVAEPPPLRLPEQLTSDEYSNFLCYTEWKGDYRYVLDNVMDPMHGTFLHKQSHSMAEGDNTAAFRVSETDLGFVFEKEGQRDVNFDWTEWASTDLHWMRLANSLSENRRPGRQLLHHRQLYPDHRKRGSSISLALPQADRLAARHLALPLSQPSGSASLGGAGARPGGAGIDGTGCQSARDAVPA